VVITVESPATARLAERILATNLGEPLLGGQTTHPSEVTVVIPVRDRAEQLDRALSALHGLNCIVVDDDSRDATSVREVAELHGADLVSLPTNLGPAGARNHGLSRVRTAYVAFVDSDVTASAQDLVRLAAHFDDPSVALIGPLIRGVARSSRPRWYQRYDEMASSLTLGSSPASVRPGANVAWLPSACLVARTAVLRDVPIRGFDPARRVGEDVDLVWRLVASGHRVRYDPSVVVGHDSRGSFASWVGRKFFYGTGSAELALRHGDHCAPADLSPAMAVASAVILLRKRSALPVGTAAVLWGTWKVRRSLRPVPGRDALALQLSARGLGWALRQESALLLRHWWPGTVLAAASSRYVRGAVLSALVIDTVVASGSSRLGLLGPAALLARRADDLAYGAGLWVGSARVRTLKALAPRWSGRGRRT
jgi:mycofactocin system glycosyltransferase